MPIYRWSILNETPKSMLIFIFSIEAGNIYYAFLSPQTIELELSFTICWQSRIGSMLIIYLQPFIFITIETFLNATGYCA